VTKREAIKLFKTEILPLVRAKYETDGVVDHPARAEAWNNWTEALCKRSLITPRQYETWDNKELKK